MKKIVIRSLIMMVMLLGIVQLRTYAATLEKEQTVENTLNLSITADSGIVTALSATFQIEGNVELDNFTWAENMKQDCMKEYRYNKEQKTLNVYITPVNGDNLSVDGKLQIGTIKVKSTTTQKYTINLKESNLVNGNYRISQEEVKNTQKTFTSLAEIKDVPSFTTALNTNKTQFVPGEEFEVTVKVSDFKNMDKGLIAIAGQLEYNYDILERISIEGQNNWNLDGNSFNEKNFKFIMDTNDYVTSEQVIFKMKFKVKGSIVVPRDTLITVKNITGSNGNTDITANDATVSLKVVEETKQDSITSTKYTIKNSFISRIIPETKISEFKNNIKAQGNIVITDKKGTILGENDTIATGMKIKVGATLEYTLVVTGDIDGNGVIGLTDFAKLKLHYIELETLTGSVLEAADLDENGSVSLTDIAQIKLVLIGLMEIK